MSTLNKEQTKAFEIMASGKNVFLTGNAGTGKAFDKNFYKILPKPRKEYHGHSPDRCSCS